jgi:nitrite reductase/ring-hydroxylating ferredoxin subunit
MTRQRVCRLNEVTGKLLPVDTGRGTILLTRLPSGAVKAVASRCPHQGADLAYGCLTGLSQGERSNCLESDRPGEILRCPWHGFEFDLVTGVSVVDRGRPRLRLKQFRVEIEGDDVFVIL